jgi:hypothetical protein
MRVYSITHKKVAMTGAVQTLIELTAAATKSVCLLRAWIAQTTNTTSAMQDVTITRKSGAGTNATAPIVNAVDPDDAAFGGTVRGLCTTVGTLTTDQYPDGFNWANGWLWVPNVEDRIWVPGGGIIGIHLPTAPAALTINMGLVIGEVG